MEKPYKIFAYLRGGECIVCRNFELLPDNYIKIGVEEPTPIEDYGDWVLIEDEATDDEIMGIILANI